MCLLTIFLGKTMHWKFRCPQPAKKEKVNKNRYLTNFQKIEGCKEFFWQNQTLATIVIKRECTHRVLLRRVNEYDQPCRILLLQTAQELLLPAQQLA